MTPLELKTSDGLTIAVPAALTSMTTYALLEQERWFEKETDFLRAWLKPGMTAIDIGANLGVYSLLAARLVGPAGQVHAYEPGSDARAMLERSRKLNGAENLHIIPLALSDGEREGHLVFGQSSELNALGDTGAGEKVRITSLDKEDAARGWASPDFVKIDAEGEEERILAGAKSFFDRHAPLVMFENKAVDKVNQKLRELLPTMGYRVFRQLGGAPLLVPDDPQQPLDPFELNLFAAKPGRVESLARDGLLVESVAPFTPTDADRAHAEALWQQQPFAMIVAMPKGGVEPDYQDALVAYAVWRDLQQPALRRVAALFHALTTLRALGRRAPTIMRLSTFARVAWDWGARSEVAETLQRLLQMQSAAPSFRFDEPFWLAHPRFDRVPHGASPRGWFALASAEQFELAHVFSSYFMSRSPVLDWLCQQPLAAAQMQRRHVLRAARGGLKPVVPPRLTQGAADHLNAGVWRKGKVPGTLTKPGR